jgi:multisubunit Na+/H+ antiporter MnhG subunit
MTAATLAVEVLLWFAVAVAWISCLGMLLMKGVFEKLHYLAPVATVSMFAILAAVVVEEGAGQAAMKTILIAVVLLLINAVVTHATARAHRVEELGDWKPLPGETFPGTQAVPALPDRKGNQS